jgi:acetoin utilization deacetylase AcuC-like enzyme
MKIAYSPVYTYQHLPEGHRFPMEKYDLIPMQLLHEGVVEETDFFHPAALTESQILRTHTLDYWDKLKNGTLTRHEIRAMGFPYHPSLIERGRHIAHGTLECARFAIQEGVALNVAGGTHHSYADRGEGFCIFNDFAIAANELLFHKEVKQILIIDLDVHQGNGTAKIFENHPQVFTFSVHGAHNYPLKKEKSDLDIGVPDGITDADYLELIEQHVPDLISTLKPDLVFYLSGVDVLKTDKLGRLALTKEGCKQRDEIVFKNCYTSGTPVTVSMGGGYSVQIADIVEAHVNTFKTAQKIFG